MQQKIEPLQQVPRRVQREESRSASAPERRMSHVVKVPGPLRSYTHGAAQVSAAGDTLEQLLAELERTYSGMRFRMIDEQARIRPHIRIFINTREAAVLTTPLASGDVVHLICALSGG